MRKKLTEAAMNSGAAMPWAERIFAYRQAHHYTQEQLAYKLGVSVRTVSYLEQGKHQPHRGTILLLARVGIREEAPKAGMASISPQ